MGMVHLHRKNCINNSFLVRPWHRFTRGSIKIAFPIGTLTTLKRTLHIIDFISQPEPNSIRPFSRATRAGGLIFVSGHSAPHNPANSIERGDTPGAQVRNALTFSDSILRAEGSSLQRVVQVTILITDPANYAACNEEYVKHFPNGLPAHHTARFGVPTEAIVGFYCIAMAADR